MGVMLGFKMNQQKPHSSSSSGIINFFLLLSFFSFFFFSNKKEKKKGLLVTQLSLWHLTAVVIRPFSLIFGINYCFSICLSQNPIIMHKTKPYRSYFHFPFNLHFGDIERRQIHFKSNEESDFGLLFLVF